MKSHLVSERQFANWATYIICAGGGRQVLMGACPQRLTEVVAGAIMLIGSVVANTWDKVGVSFIGASRLVLIVLLTTYYLASEVAVWLYALAC